MGGCAQPTGQLGRWVAWIAPAAVLSLLASSPASASEVFTLANGTQLVGKWLNQNELLRTHYDLETSTGIKLKLERTQVVKVDVQRPAEEEYSLRKTQCADTVEAQWELAEWCRLQHLSAERAVHLKRIIELQGDHPEARAALGYTLTPTGWLTQAQRMELNGFQRYRGRWRMPQEIELIEKKEKQERAEKEWFRKVKMLRGWYESTRQAQAVQRFKEIDDPFAVRALREAVAEEPEWRIRKMYVETLGQIKADNATAALVDISLKDPHDEVRYTAMDAFPEKDPEIVALYIAALKSKDNVVINRAAEGLKKLNHPGAVPSLIDSLVTSHKYKVTIGNPGGGLSTTFAQPNSAGSSASNSGFGGFGFSAGGQTKIVTQLVSNVKVLDALISLSGQNYQWNVQQWKLWLANNRVPDSAGSRRD